LLRSAFRFYDNDLFALRRKLISNVSRLFKDFKPVIKYVAYFCERRTTFVLVSLFFCCPSASFEHNWKGSVKGVGKGRMMGEGQNANQS